MKRIAKLLIVLMLLSVFSACEAHPSPPISETEMTESLSEVTTVTPEMTTVPDEATTVTPKTTTVPDEATTVTPETTAEPDETTAVTPETTAEPDEATTVTPETTAEPDETTAVTPETTTLPDETTLPSELDDPPEVSFSVEDDDGRIEPQFYYTWSGDAYDPKSSASTVLPLVFRTLPVFTRSDTVRFVIPQGGAVTRIVVYDAEFSENARVSGTDPAVIGRLRDGLWYVLVGLTVSDGEKTTGYEFLFSIYVGETQILLDDGTAFRFPKVFHLGGETYDAATDSFKSNMTSFDPTVLLQSDLPIVTCNEYLSYTTLGSFQSLALHVYDQSVMPVITEGDSLSALSDQLTAGIYYVVISVTWEGNYIESHERFETERCEYAFLMTIS